MSLTTNQWIIASLHSIIVFTTISIRHHGVRFLSRRSESRKFCFSKERADFPVSLPLKNCQEKARECRRYFRVARKTIETNLLTTIQPQIKFPSSYPNPLSIPKAFPSSESISQPKYYNQPFPNPKIQTRPILVQCTHTRFIGYYHYSFNFESPSQRNPTLASS